ncbi:unnamed protein product [Notodromas monacha]|uniref:Phorbol-ester/DAG-type domain-containing protein n=1 Tax=Notodromas monacha TaxID=399045 RepID=A0A7R9BCX4_9CRUS|nr:unnamed protein product [Notodromas monacha]CAG0912224.1 unnamed protein product [Notodromas monacha]
MTDEYSIRSALAVACPSCLADVFAREQQFRQGMRLYSPLALANRQGNEGQLLGEKFPGHGLGRLSERLILFRHDYSNQNQLALINSAADITTETLVEIVLNATLPPEEQITVVRPHELDVHSYRTPTFCDSCGEMLFGLMKQGLQCRGCNQNFHKRCVSRIPNGCQDTRRRPSASHNLLPVPLQPSPSATCSIGIGYTSEDSSSQPSSRTPSLAPPRSPTMSAGRGCWAEGRPASNIGLKIPHTFVVHTYTRPTMCHSCRKLLKGLLRQGMQCRDCKLNVHKKCSERIQNDCIGEAPRESHDVLDVLNEHPRRAIYSLSNGSV